MGILQGLSSDAFMPHGHCYLWTPSIMWGHALADAVIALAYFSIPVVLVVLVRRRPDVSFSRVVLLFAVFILACGTGHVLDIWNIWHGAYGWSLAVRVITAAASIGTAVVLWPLLPTFLAIPSHGQLEREIADRTHAQAALREAHDGLEERVHERTRELEDFAHLTADREERMIDLKREVNALSGALGRPPVYDLGFADVSRPTPDSPDSPDSPDTPDIEPGA